MILPNHLQAGPAPFRGDEGSFGQLQLRQGEVVATVLPSDPKSQSGRFLEYAVRVQHRANGTAGVIEYPHCLLVNPLAGLADRARWRLRPDPAAGVDGKPGLGSKVLILCVNGERTNAYILGGIRDEQDDDQDVTEDEPRGADLTMNGLTIEVGDDGGLAVTFAGATAPDGTLDEDTTPVDQTGTALTLEGDGSFQVALPHAKDDQGNDTEDDDPHQQVLRMDHDSKDVTLLADTALTVTVQGETVIEASGGTTLQEHQEDLAVTADEGDVEVSTPKGQVRLGKGADEPAVLGNVLAGIWGEAMDEIAQIIVGTGTGPSTPPQNAARFQQLKQKFKDALSQQVFVIKKE